jgi:hypothetical protein
LAPCVLAFCAEASLHAQGAAPPAPDTTPIRGAGVPAYLQLFKRVAAPVVLADPAFRVLVAAAPTAATLDAVDALDTLGRSCKSSAHSAGAPPTYASDAVGIDGSYLVVVAVPRAAVSGGTCEARWNAEALSIWRALSFGGPIAAGHGVPKSLRLLVDGTEVKPTRTVARPAYEVRDGVWSSIPSQLRYYYPMSAIAPGARRSRRMITVQLWEPSGARVSSLEMLSTDVQRLRYQYDAWRLATSTGDERAVALEPRHRVPQDVRDALDLAARGQTDSAALRAAERLAVAGASSASEYGDDVAAMIVAEVLYQHGDTAAALGTIADVRAGRRCLNAPAGASTTLMAATRGQLRGSCIARNPLGTLAMGIVPGGGHLFRGNPVVGALAAAGLSTVFISARSTQAASNSTYARYQASRSYTETPVLFQRAMSQRAAARSRAQLGVALWAADAVLAAIITSAKNHVVSNGRL